MSLLTHKEPKKRLLLIDGHGIIYRSYFAIRGLATSNGFPTNAIYGFLQSLDRVVREFPSTHVVVAMDSRGKTIRHEEYKEYKANRPEMPEDLSRQIPEITDLTEKLGYKVIRKEGYEADDVIAKLTGEGQDRGLEVIILTGDKDLMQLVDENIKVVDTDKDNQLEVIGSEKVKEKFGVNPGQIRDYLALVGDKSDNIPGVPQIGEVRAKKLLDKFNSLDNLLAQIDAIKSNHIKNTLKEHQEKALQGKNLVTLRDDIELSEDLDSLQIGNPDLSELRKNFKRLELASFLEDCGSPEEKIDWKLITSEDQLDELITEIVKKKEISIDLETDDLNPINANPLGISISTGVGTGSYMPMVNAQGPSLSNEIVKKKLGPIIEDETIGKMGQNLKYDGLVLKRIGIDLKGITFDSMIASYLIKPTKRRHSLKEIVKTYLGQKMQEYKDLFSEAEEEDFTKLPMKKAAAYAVGDAEIIWKLKKPLMSKIQQRDQEKLLNEIEIPLIRVLRDMEFKGIILKKDRLENGRRKLEERLNALQENINELAGEELNPNSPKQVREILFDKLELPVIERTKTGPSTNAQVLNELSDKHPLPEKIIEYREISKLLNTYVETLPGKINQNTGRIHTSFNQTTTATGRLSSSDPNLQNIPKGSQLGSELRKAFVPREGYLLLGADYSQIELRLLAHLSEDQELIQTFKEGEDLHRKTAAQIFGVHPDWIDDKMRDRAKRVNFGIVYGITEYGLSRDLGISRSEAKAYIDQFFNLYPKTKTYIDELIGEAEENHYAQTIFNRRRYLPNINSNNWNRKSYDRRNAINTPIQGSAADLIKLAMIDVNKKIQDNELSGELLLQIHDELIMEVPESEAKKTAQQLKNLMENTMELKVPLKVDVSSGKDWSEL